MFVRPTLLVTIENNEAIITRNDKRFVPYKMTIHNKTRVWDEIKASARAIHATDNLPPTVKITTEKVQKLIWVESLSYYIVLTTKPL